MCTILPWALHYTVPCVDHSLKATVLRSDWLIRQGPKATVPDLSCNPEACGVLNLNKYIIQVNDTGEKPVFDYFISISCRILHILDTLFYILKKQVSPNKISEDLKKTSKVLCFFILGVIFRADIPSPVQFQHMKSSALKWTEESNPYAFRTT